MDKDQSQMAYWPDNDERGGGGGEAAVATDNFFDQFLSFEPGDPAVTAAVENFGLDHQDLFEEDPPSPSLLLESLKHENILTQGQEDYDHKDHQSSDVTDDLTTAVVPTPVTVPSPPALSEAGHQHQNHEQSTDDLLAVLTGDPVLGSSISDSELLRLEGISLRSPKARAPTTTTTSTPPSGSLSPRKHSRFVDSVYGTFRRVVHRNQRPGLSTTGSKPYQQQYGGSMTARGMGTSPVAPSAHRNGVRAASSHAVPQNQHYYHQHRHQRHPDDIIIKPEPVDNAGLPLSPPLTGTIPTLGAHGHANNGVRFVNGHVDDPFCDGFVDAITASGPQTTNSQGQDTPMSTPVMDVDGLFFPDALADPSQGGNGTTGYTQVKQEGHLATTEGDWGMEDALLTGTAADDAQLWGVSMTDTGDSGELQLSSEWWENDCEKFNQLSALHNQQHDHLNPHQNAQGQQLSTVDLSSYDYGTGTATDGGLSGLMIHMPQPRQPQAAVLVNDELLPPSASSSSNGATLQTSISAPSSSVVASSGSSFPMPTLSTSHPNYPPTPQHHLHHQQHHHYHNHTPHHTERRPRPRAPSSGARHHGSMTSPRKLHHSSSRPFVREESSSPTPTQHGHGHQQQHQRSSSISVRKRRSFCRRTASGTALSSAGGGHEPRTPSSSSSSAGSGGFAGNGGGGGGAIGFVNFTPSDKNVLMTGVAPSGSSKTKLRREKEAQDRQRKLSEATLRAVREAGGDVNKFIEQGLHWDHQHVQSQLQYQHTGHSRHRPVMPQR